MRNLLPGWKTSNKSSGQTIYTNPCGRVVVQDTHRRSGLRFNVTARTTCIRSRRQTWLEVTATASARDAAASALATVGTL